MKNKGSGGGAQADRARMREYSIAHWSGDMLPDEWRRVDIGPLVERAVEDLTKGKQKGQKFFVRVGGQSGAGKSTQLLPMVEEYFRELRVVPVVVGARFFVRYHPFLKEIMVKVGEENLREATQEFVVQMLYESLLRILRMGYPVVLDVSLQDPAIEGMLAEVLLAEGYESELHMMAVSREISDGFVKKREKSGGEGGRRVREETSEQFMRATPLALKFYAERMPEMRVSLWSAWDSEPVFDGVAGDGRMMEVWDWYQETSELPFETDEEELREAKKAWARKRARRLG